MISIDAAVSILVLRMVRRTSAKAAEQSASLMMKLRAIEQPKGKKRANDGYEQHSLGLLTLATF
jgi:hypothetical protein